MRRNTAAAPTPSVASTRWGRVSRPSAHASGTDPMAAAAPRSAAIMTRRASLRSTQAPAGRPMSSQGSQAAAVSRPIQPGPASKTVTATSGTTTEVVIEPSTDTPSPTHSSRKLRLPAIGGAVADGAVVPAVTAGSGSRGRRRAPARGARRRRAPRGCPSARGGRRSPGTPAELVGGQPQPVLGRERHVVPLGGGLGVDQPVAHALLLPAQVEGLGLLGRGDRGLVGELAAAPPGAGGHQPPPALALVAGQLGGLLDEPGGGQHLEVVARVADRLPGAQGEHGCRRRAVDLERVHDPRAERVGERGERRGIAQGAYLRSGHAAHGNPTRTYCTRRSCAYLPRSQDHFAGSGAYSVLTRREPPEPAKCA